MATPRHLNRAPITEALIDIHVEQQAGLSFEMLQQAFNKIGVGYYVKGPISHGTFVGQFSLDGQQQPQASMQAELVGLRLHSADEKYVAQCRLGGFTLSRLPPYEDWESLLQETKRVWSIYCELLKPMCITRLATRFINNLRLPIENGESFQVYLKKFADVPDEAPQAMASFFQNFKLVDITEDAYVNLILALDSLASDGTAPVILDIDVFTSKQMSPASDEVWGVLECLRNLKNKCFFGSLTDRAVELYE